VEKTKDELIDIVIRCLNGVDYMEAKGVLSEAYEKLADFAVVVSDDKKSEE